MATIAEEVAANARARAEGYQSAAHKEAHANAQSKAAGFSNAVAAEIDANKRAQAAGFRNAAEQEMDANRRSKEAGFTSAVDQEIDANRRAREAGYLNAADLETYGAAGATRSTDPFLDPRLQPAPVIPEKFRLGTANLLKYNPDQPNVPGYDPNWRNDPKYASGFDVHGNPITGGGVTTVGGPPNPTVPSFGYPQYQDWTRFMPTNFQLAEGGGMHYQPGAWGNLPGAGGAAIGAGNNIWNTGTVTGGTTATGGPGSINPNIWGTSNANVNTTGVRPGSDKANDLAAGRTHHPQMYDANDMWIGAEGTPMGGGTRGLLGATQGSTGGITGNAPAWENPNLYGTDFFGGDVTAPAGTDFFGGDVTAPAGTDFYGGDVTSPTGPNTAPPGSGPGVDFWGGGVTSPTGPNTGVPGFGPGVDFYGGDVTSPTGPNTGVPGAGPGVDFWGGGVTAPMGPNTGLPGLAEMQAAQAQAQAANAAAIAAYGGGDYGLLEGGGGAEVDVSGGNGGRGGWDSGEPR